MSNELIGQLVETAIVLAVAIVTYLIVKRTGQRVVSRVALRGHEAGARANTLWVMIRRIVLVVLVVLTVLITLDAVWGFDLTAFLAIGTIVGAALGFGAQDVVKDLLAGFFILAEDQYQIGDVVTIAGTSGLVEDIQFRVTVLRDLEGNVHFVPNGQIKVTSNMTSHYAKPVLDVGVAYKEDVDRALDVMRDELNRLATDEAWKEMITDPVEMLGVDQLADSAVILRARLSTRADDRWTVKREALRRIKNRFDREGIEIPFPHLTVYKGDG